MANITKAERSRRRVARALKANEAFRAELDAMRSGEVVKITRRVNRYRYHGVTIRSTQATGQRDFFPETPCKVRTLNVANAKSGEIVIEAGESLGFVNPLRESGR